MALTNRYLENNGDSLDEVFVNWNKQLQPNRKSFIEQDERTKAVYDVFRQFYKSYDLLELGNLEWANKLNENSRYVLIQDRILYSVSTSEDPDSICKEILRDSIINFRPPVDVPRDKVLYLNVTFGQGLQNFLSSDQLSTTGQSQHISNDEAPVRQRLISSYVKLLPRNLGGSRHFTSDPYITSIVFNSSLSMASIDFLVGYQGGNVTMKKVDGKWIIVRPETNWIE